MTPLVAVSMVTRARSHVTVERQRNVAIIPLTSDCRNVYLDYRRSILSIVLNDDKSEILR